MVLKTLTHDRPGGSDCWNYYDDVEFASNYYDEEKHVACVSLKFRSSGETIVVALHDVAYLCNDFGRTIEKLYPKTRDV